MPDGYVRIATPGLEAPRLLRPAAVAAGLLALVVLMVSAAPEVERSGPLNGPASSLSALPLAAQSLVSRTLGRGQVSYAIQAHGGDLSATNEPNGIAARFGANGVQVRSSDHTLSLRLRAAGYGHSLDPVTAAAPTKHANRVSYRHGYLDEWYVNGPLGLEQGFTLKAPPAAHSPGKLTLSLALAGSLHPALERGARTLTFADSSLRYTGLAAFDARGTRLPARLDLRGRTLLIRVDDRGAKYPLTIDPFLQLAKLIGSTPDGFDPPFELGRSVAISGDTIVAGAPGTPEGSQDGDVYVFVEPAGGWANGVQTAILTASDRGFGQELGTSVAIDGDTIVAGAPNRWGNLSSNPAPGAAYVFVKPAGGWTNGTETAKLTTSDGVVGDDVGYGVAISGNTIVAGAMNAKVSGHSGQGAAYVFVKPAGGWATGTQTAKLTASDGAAADLLGAAVAISGDTIVGGAPDAGHVPGHAGAGAAYVFVKPTGGWATGTQTAKLTASDAANSAYLGSSVGISGGTIVVGAPRYQDTAAYVFVEPVGGWANTTEVGKLTPSDGAGTNNDFGISAAIAGDTIVVGAMQASNPSSGCGGCGAAYVFQVVPAAITVTKHLVPATDPGRFDLKVGGNVIKQGAGDGGSGATSVDPGTYRISESAAAGTTLSNYSTSIACTLNGAPGPSADGSAQLDVTVTVGDRLDCTITNRRKAKITLAKHLIPTSDPGRFDLKVGANVVKAGAGDGDSGSTQVGAGTYALSEDAAGGTILLDYASSVACKLNGKTGPSGTGPSLNVSLTWADVLSCTITNQPGATVTLTKQVVPATDPGRFELRIGQAVVKAGARDGGTGSLGVLAGTYRVNEIGAAGASLADYSTSIACTLNGNPGPSAGGTTQLTVTLAVHDKLACTLTNRRKATITVTKHLLPTSDPGRFDLKVGATVVAASAGDGGSGSRQVGAATYAVAEVAAAGTSLSAYSTSIACTLNGGAGPSGNGSSLKVSVTWGDALACTITNQRS
jgi:hypothetical protein